MVRETKISVPVTDQEKRLIRANAELNMYGSMAAFLRDRALETDISNKALLAIILTYLSSHIKDLSRDKNLDWTRRKADMKHKLSTELAGLNKKQREAYLGKVEKTLDNALEIKKELDNILGKYFIEE